MNLSIFFCPLYGLSLRFLITSLVSSNFSRKIVHTGKVRDNCLYSVLPQVGGEHDLLSDLKKIAKELITTTNTRNQLEELKKTSRAVRNKNTIDQLFCMVMLLL